MIDHIDSPDFQPSIASYKTIGYYIYESGEYESDSPLGFRSSLLEAEALRHFVAENRCHKIKWYPNQQPNLDIYSFDIMEIKVPC